MKLIETMELLPDGDPRCQRYVRGDTDGTTCHLGVQAFGELAIEVAEGQRQGHTITAFAWLLGRDPVIANVSESRTGMRLAYLPVIEHGGHLGDLKGEPLIWVQERLLRGLMEVGFAAFRQATPERLEELLSFLDATPGLDVLPSVESLRGGAACH